MPLVVNLKAVIIRAAIACSVYCCDLLAADPSPSVLTSVVLSTDRKTVEVSFTTDEKPHSMTVQFEGAVEEFRYCPWLGAYGIAIVARVGSGEDASYYVANNYFSSHLALTEIKAARIQAPKGHFPGLGIGNTGGDSIVISALRHSRNPSEVVSGWLWTSNCPLPSMPLAVGTVKSISEIPVSQFAPSSTPAEKTK
jgi:hypothetical protein